MTKLKEQSQVKSISEILDESSFGAAIRAYDKYGYHSKEHLAAIKTYQAENAKNNAEEKSRKEINQAWLYEQGY